MKAFRRSGRSGWRGRVTLDFVVCLLIVATHFINYLQHTGYDRLFPDLLLCGAVLSAVALAATLVLQVPVAALRTLVFALLVLTVFSDSVFEYGTTGGGGGVTAVMVILGVLLILCFVLRRHINKILVAVFAAMLAAQAVPGLVPVPTDKNAVTGMSTVTADKSLPVVVHIVLDEQAGLAAMAPELPDGDAVRATVRDFYVGNGLRVFARAYSRYFETHASLARMFNPDQGEGALRRAEKHRNKYILTDNGYFKEWAEKGYRINVLQSSYLDFCRTPDVPVHVCRTYKHDAFAPETIAELPTGDRVGLILRMYASSLTLVKLARLADRVGVPYLNDLGLPVPRFQVWHGRVGPLAAAAPLKGFIADVARSRGGDMFFAHLLMPHYPYVYDENCRIRRPVEDWRLRTLDGNGDNTPENRRLRYGDYFKQVRCTLKQLAPLFGAMRRAGTFDDATIVVHGDHGSRITRIDPIERNKANMTDGDFVDSFSTLFAVKAPGNDAGADPRMAPLTELLRGTVFRHGGDMHLVTNPFVYLRAADDSFSKVGLPELPLRP